jgi:hypothetical protein
MSNITKSSTILVTGADVFIGSHPTAALVRIGLKARPLFTTTHLTHGDG